MVDKQTLSSAVLSPSSAEEALVVLDSCCCESAVGGVYKFKVGIIMIIA